MPLPSTSRFNLWASNAWAAVPGCTTRAIRAPDRTRARSSSATLHAVGGFGDVVIAVGGELSTATPSQRGVILVQDDEATTFTLDGRVYDSGGVMGSAGGAGQ